MPGRNAEIVRASFEAWLAGEERWLEAIDPEIEWDFTRYPIPDVPATGRGRDEFARSLSEFRSSWTAYDSRIADLVEVDDVVVVVYHETIRLRESDTTLERDVSIAWTMRNGRAIRFDAYPSRADVLAAVGLAR